jgi:hypothetical protein
MDPKKLEKIISIIREQMVSNVPGTQGGFSGSSDPKGPTAGFDPVMGFKRRKGPQIKLPAGSRKRWMNRK